MGYTSKIHDSRGKAYDHLVATKILDKMKDLRMDNDNNSARRWIWELLQNARDVAYDDGKVKVSIKASSGLHGGLVEFKHTGKPFSIDNITFLIEQVSSKDRDKEGEESAGSKRKPSGKFGTGFLTTHLLSEIVGVEGVAKEDDEQYKKFSLKLDRSGRDIATVINSVNASLETLLEIDSADEYRDYDAHDFNTVFQYQLDSSGEAVAETGLLDLNYALPYTLAFLPEIESVTIEHDNLTYKIISDPLWLNDLIQVVEVQIGGGNSRQIAVLTENGTSIALPIKIGSDGSVEICEMKEELPMLFCDFPLVGSEDFNFPCVINSSAFNPNEPRNGVFLTDKSDPEIEQNKGIMADAINLYFQLLDFASANGWKNIHLLAHLKEPSERKWLSLDYFREFVMQPIRNKLLITPIVDTVSGNRVALKNSAGGTNIWFPSSLDKDIRHGIFSLAKQWIPSMLPLEANIDFWSSVIWGDCSELTLPVIFSSVQKRETLKSVSEMLTPDVQEPIKWLNQLYDLAIQDGIYIGDLISGKYSIFPNQNGALKKKGELYHDAGIEEELKNVLAILGGDSRDYLVSAGVIGGDQIYFDERDQAFIIGEINKLIRDDKNEKQFLACANLLALFPHEKDVTDYRKNVYRYFKDIYRSSAKPLKAIGNWSDEIWDEADRLALKWLVQLVSKCGNVEELAQRYSLGEFKDALKWLDGFITFLNESSWDNLVGLKMSPILPNQNGVFTIKDDLYLDDGTLDETLKDIAAECGNDFRDILLHKDIFLELAETRTVPQTEIAEYIMREITPKFSEMPRTEETKSLFRKLYLWFTSNKAVAQVCFRELYASKHKLYDDEEIANTFEENEQYKSLLTEFGITDQASLRERLSQSSATSVLHPKMDITQENLASLGITTIPELEEAMKDVKFNERFTHTVTPTLEMLAYAQGLIARAKSNIIKKLKSLPIYDCTDLEELATTVLGGIKKDGLEIHVVVRPSDNGEVLFYYGSEKDTLDYENAELWIDNGIEDPRLLTLGKILKTTGITRIPI